MVLLRTDVDEKGPLQREFNGADIPDPALFRANLGVDETATEPTVPEAGGTFTGLVGFTYGATLTAAGTTQGDALELTDQFNRIATCASGAGVKLPATTKKPIFIRNDGANDCTVYPNTGAAINGGSANAGLLIAANGGVTLLLPRSLSAWESFL